jgi:hypothetical protein
VLQQIRYHECAGHVTEHDGFLWVVATHAELGDEIGLSSEQARRAAEWLRDPHTTRKLEGKTVREPIFELEPFIFICRPQGYDRRTWYRINHQHPGLSDSSNRRIRQIESADLPDRIGESAASSSTETEERTERAPRKRGSLPPADFAPNATHREIAAEYGLELVLERRAWIAHCKAKNVRDVDHDAAFEKWLLDEVKHSSSQPKPDVLDLSDPPSGPSFVPQQQGPRPTGMYVCPLELGCENGMIEHPNGGYLQCECVSSKVKAFA